MTRRCLAALATALLLLAGCGDEPEADVPNAPPIVNAGAPDPGGDDRAPLRLPPDGRWFGLSAPLYGVEDRPPRYDPEATAADVAKLPVNAHRISIPWVDLEPLQGQIDRAGLLAPARRFADALKADGIKLVIVLGGTPGWASAEPGNPAGAPKDDADAAFASYAALVARTFPDALAIETWNEPNAKYAWSPIDGDAAERYARLHKAAAAAIRKAAPNVKVLLGGIVAGDDNEDVVQPQRYLKRMYAAGLAPEDYDALAVHLYPGQAAGRIRPLTAGNQLAKGLADFRAGYRWRDPAANLWVTETGVSTSGPDAVSPAAQARDVSRILRRLLSITEVEGVFLHTLIERGDTGKDRIEQGYGVRDAKRRPKPAACTLEDLATDPPQRCR